MKIAKKDPFLNAVDSEVLSAHLDVVQRCRTTALWHSQALTVPGEEDQKVYFNGIYVLIKVDV